MIKFKTLQDEIDFFSPSEEINVRVQQVGDDKVAIIDNFYKHPEQVRALALQIPSTRSPTLMHALPGSRVEGTFYFGHFAEFITEIITSVFVEDTKIDRDFISSCLNHATFLVNVQTSKEALSAVRLPHVDNLEKGRYALGIYLNTPEQCTGGTAFFKFKGEQSIDLVSLLKSDPDLRGYDFYVQESDANWEKIYTAEMKFNRLVIYKQNILHTPYIPVDSFTEENPRLIQMFFL
jgi:hypothetical protein